MPELSTANRSLRNTENGVEQPSDSGINCQILSAEEFLSDPSRVADIAGRGTQVCIRTPNTVIIVGHGEPLSGSNIKWGFWQKLRFTAGRVFRSGSGPLDVSWIE